ncbi:MAG: PQQ-binding-like beta-propeller repeat protein [Planctomycetes bacterium]|nr:PQQ-binding-like beta-propeller repeat protein [Planctomycetota bacterium]
MFNRRRAPHALWMGLIPLALFALPSFAEDQTSARATVDESEEKLSALLVGDRQAQDGDVRQALLQYQRLLDESQGELVVHALHPECAEYQGVKSVCRARVWSLLRAEGTALREYRAQFGARAADLFEAGRRGRDLALLSRVASDYGPTTSGGEAARLLMDLHLEAGDAESALPYAERLLSFADLLPERSPPFGECFARALLAYARAGHVDRVFHLGVGVALQLRAAAAMGEFFLGGRFGLPAAPPELLRGLLRLPVRLGGKTTTLREVRRACLEHAVRRRGSPVRDWAGQGGGVRHRRDMAHAKSIAGAAWMLPFRVPLDLVMAPPPAASPRFPFGEPARMIEVLDPAVASHVVSPFGLAVARDWALVHDGLHVQGVRLDSGERSEWYVSDWLPRPIGRYGPGEEGAWGNFGLAAQRDLVLSLHRRRTTSEARRLPRISLRASDLEAEGKRLWDVSLERRGSRLVAEPRGDASAGTGAADEEPPGEATFCGPPITDGQRVYAGAIALRNDVESFLVCLDATTGRVLWSSLLCGEQVEPSNPVVRPALAPAKAGGRVYFCSNQGVVGAFDALTGETVWAAKYARQVGSRQGAPARSGESWADNPPLVVEDELFVTPQDADALWIFEAPTGRVLSSQFKRNPGVEKYTWMVAGAADRVYLVGRKQGPQARGEEGTLGVVLPIRTDLRRVDPTVLPEAPAGRPGVCGDAVYVPTTKALRRVRPLDKKKSDPVALVTWAATGGEAGDVLVVDGRCLILSPRGVLRGYPVKAK